MRTTYDLSCLSWSVSGWHPLFWNHHVSMETGFQLPPDVPPVSARVPGSVQGALCAAGVLPDWNVGLNSRQCEWVENRHWVYETTLPGAWLEGGEQVMLCCAGMDYQGLVYANRQLVGRFCGTHTPHTFDLTPFVTAAETRLAIVFTDNPHYLGQIGHTSTMTEWKARFYYVWDWVPRLVQIGIWDTVQLEVRRGDAIDDVSLYTTYDAAAGIGSLRISAKLTLHTAVRVEIELDSDGQPVAIADWAAAPAFDASWGGWPVTAWHPNGNGAQALYQVRIRLRDATGQVLDEQARMTGFRQITWKACVGAPADAEPWICCVNGVDTFLQGANWVPIRPNFADVTDEDYGRVLQVYHDAGFNLLRVWGGAILETECFYRRCDALGLLVWQEFPLSSSGLDNWPPESPAAIDAMRGIAVTYIARRQHHPALLMWCGGNELQGALGGGKQGIGKPVDNSHPMMAMLAAAVAAFDPTRRFVPTSASGPRFTASEREFGQQLHHDVHGPWGMAGPLDHWQAYWDRDDALLRSETGMPGCSPAAMIERYAGALAPLPADRSNLLWTHSGSWWVQWDDYLAAGGDPKSLGDYVAWSQQRQAEALAYATRRCKERFPAMGGIIFWMGHDCFPVPANNSLIDFDGQPKPALNAVAEVFHTAATSSAGAQRPA
jgi:beta-mannosidase